MWYYLFLAFTLTLPFGFALNPTSNIDLPTTRILVPILFSFWFFEGILKKRILIDTRLRFFVLVSFVFLVLVSLFWALDPLFGIRKAVFLFSVFPIYFVSFAATRKKGRKNMCLSFLVWGGFAVSIFAIVQFLLQFVIGLEETLAFIRWYIPFFLGNSFATLVFNFPSWLVNISGTTVLRAFGSFPDPHLFALYVNMLTPFSFLLYATTKKRFYLVMALIMITAGILSFSRASYLSLFSALLFFVFTKNIFNIFKKYFLSTLFLVFIVMSLVLIPNPLTTRLGSSFDIQEGSNIGRIEMWKTAIEIIKENPLRGVGIGNFSYYIDTTLAPKNPIYAHNILLDFGAEIGILGIILLLIILLSPIVSFFQNRSSLKLAIAVSFVVFFIHSLFENPFFSIHTFPLFCILLALNDND